MVGMSLHPEFEYFAKIGGVVLCVADASRNVTIAHSQQNICYASQVAFTLIRIKLAQRIKIPALLLDKLSCSSTSRASTPQPSVFHDKIDNAAQAHRQCRAIRSRYWPSLSPAMSISTPESCISASKIKATGANWLEKQDHSVGWKRCNHAAFHSGRRSRPQVGHLARSQALYVVTGRGLQRSNCFQRFFLRSKTQARYPIVVAPMRMALAGKEIVQYVSMRRSAACRGCMQVEARRYPLPPGLSPCTLFRRLDLSSYMPTGPAH